MNIKKIAINQPALPKYRVPLFRRLNSEYDFNVHVFADSGKLLDNVEANGFESSKSRTWRLFTDTKLELAWDWTHLRICSQRKWDAIVLSWNTRYLSLIPALILARLRGRPTIIWGHGFSKNQSKVRDWIRTLPARLAGAILFYDDVSKESFDNSTGQRFARKTFSAPNAIDQTQASEIRTEWLADPEKQNQFRQANNLVGKSVFLFVSRIDPFRQLEVLLRAVANTGRADILLAVVGKVVDEDYRTELGQLVEDLGIDQQVRFLGPIYDEEILAPWFLTSKAFCFPTHIGLSMMHAFGYGLPVILGDDFSKCGPETYAIKNEINGLTFEYGNPASLGEQMARILDDPEFQGKLSEQAYATTQTVASLDRMVSGFAASINSAIQSRQIQKTT